MPPVPAWWSYSVPKLFPVLSPPHVWRRVAPATSYLVGMPDATSSIWRGLKWQVDPRYISCNHLRCYALTGGTCCRRHRAVDTFFKDIMKKIAEHPHCLTAGIAPGLLDKFKRNNEILEGIAKGLDTFLEVSFYLFYTSTSWKAKWVVHHDRATSSTNLSVRAYRDCRK